MPELFPRVKHCELTGGVSELGIDVRLVTNNVLPIQRKAVRSVLTAAGVRVVANKKKYVVNAQVEAPEKFDLSAVPEDCHCDYYELTVSGSEVHIRSPYQEGMVWASQTLASLFRLILQEKTVPNLTIKDWPMMPMRGIFVENKWGPDRMCNTDWFQAIDAVSSVKMNTLGIGLYGCWGSCRFEGAERPSEFLMVPDPALDPEAPADQGVQEGQEDLKSEHRLRWYDPVGDMWHDETYTPFMAQQDFLAEVITYGRERGVSIIPFFNSLGHNTLLPRLRPEISALDAAGKSSGMGYCLSSPKTREFISELYGGIIDKYFPDGLEYFHIELDEVYEDYPHPDNAQKKESPWCCCKECKKHKKEELFIEYVLWLAEFLIGKGVQKIVLWNDQLTRHSSILDGKFVKRLEKAGLKDRIILHWWWYSNDKLHDSVHPKLGLKLGLAGWVAPMTCYYNWSTYDFRRPNIEKMMTLAEDEGARGAISYSVHDPSHLDHEALLGAYAWESTVAAGKPEAVQKRWAFYHFGSGSECYIKAADLLHKASIEPAFKLCLQYPYSYVNDTLKVWPRAYPEEALENLEALEDAGASLQKAASLAGEAVGKFSKLLECSKLDIQEKNGLMSMLGDAVRIQMLAEVFGWMLQLRSELKGGAPKKSQQSACEEQQAKLKERMKVFAENKAIWVVPAASQPLSALLRFLEQLADDLKACCNRKKGATVRWSLPDDWKIPQEN
jgi:hypothetical protein